MATKKKQSTYIAVALLIVSLLVFAMAASQIRQTQDIRSRAQSQEPTPSPVQMETDLCPADANDDGICDMADGELFRAQFQGETQSTSADFNGDGVVTILDFPLWQGSFAP